MPSVIDLFAGAGGLSLGFEQKSFSIDLAIEKDLWAQETYVLNHKNQNCLIADISQLPDSFFEQYKNKVDVVMGGPPCQGFSIAASNRRDKNDSRNFLYLEFLRVVGIVVPKIVIIENVKEFVKYILPSGDKLVENVAERLAQIGYDFHYKIISMSEYGIPQDRTRFIGFAIHKSLSFPFNFNDILEQFKTPPLSLTQVIGDLPIVVPRQLQDGDTIEYTIDPFNSYQQEIRNGASTISNHVPMLHTSKTIEKFKFLLEKGTKDELPDELKSHIRGNVHEISNSKFSQNHRVLKGDKIAPTITASFYSSFIHPTQPRNLTVREAARIQTFPDSFIFMGKKTTLSKKLLAKKRIVEDLHLDQFNQVGNAVPPMMARILAEICLTVLK